MQTEPDDDEARQATLQELMGAMGNVRGKRLPRQPQAPLDPGAALPPGSMPPPPGPAGILPPPGIPAPAATRGDLPPQPGDPMAGIDPRLAELIRKKQAGAA